MILFICLQISLRLTNIFNEIFSVYFVENNDGKLTKALEEKLAKVIYIARYIRTDSRCAFPEGQGVLFYFNADEDSFEYYFDDCSSMADAVGVGVEHAKVVLEEDIFKLKIKELSEDEWKTALGRHSHPNALKLMVPTINLRLMMDIASYFIFNAALNWGTAKNVAMHPSSSSSTAVQIGERFLHAKYLNAKAEYLNAKAEREKEALAQDEEPFPTVTVHFLPGGSILPGSVLPRPGGEDVEELVSQLHDQVISSEIEFRFKNKHDGYERRIDVIVGPVSFHLSSGQCKDNYLRTTRFGWYQTLLKVSFAVATPQSTEFSYPPNPCDFVERKISRTLNLADSNVKGKSKTLGGRLGMGGHGVIGELSGNQVSSRQDIASVTSEWTCEYSAKFTVHGFLITQEYLPFQWMFSYRPENYNDDLQHGKLQDPSHQSHVCGHGICNTENVKFEGTLRPRGARKNYAEMVQYRFQVARSLSMTSKQPVQEPVKKKSFFKRIWGKRKARSTMEEKSENLALEVEQKLEKVILLNHSMSGLQFYEVMYRLQEVGRDDHQTHLVDEVSGEASSWSGQQPLLESSSTLRDMSG